MDYKTIDYKWVILSNLGCFKNFKLNTSFCRVFYGLSENYKIIKIEQLKFNL